MRRHKADRVIMALTLVLMAVGLLTIYAIGPVRAYFLNAAYGASYSENSFFIHQLISVVLAIIAFVSAYLFPYEKLRTYAKAAIILGLALCALLWMMSLVHIPLAKCELGACRWISLGSTLSFQPAELLKFGLILYLAQLVARRRAELGDEFEESTDFWVPFAAMSVLSLGFVVVIQKDLGTGVALMVIILMILFMSGVSFKRFLMVLGIVGLAGILAIVTSPHRMERLMTFSSGGDDGSSYHVENALLAIGTGGIFGVGVGNSVQATGYLPESINDSVFAVMGETFGFVGLSVVMLLFVTLLNHLLKVSERLEDREQRLVVVGIFAWVMTHVVVNVAAMTGLIPLTGITLPLLSYGGTSMMFISAALGLALQLSCFTGRKEAVR